MISDVISSMTTQVRRLGRRGVSLGVYGIRQEIVKYLVEERPFLDIYFQKRDWFVDVVISNAAQELMNGKDETAVAVRMGRAIAEDLRNQVAGNLLGLKPNAPSTVKRKGSSTPLVDTHLLLHQISYKSDK